MKARALGQGILPKREGKEGAPWIIKRYTYAVVGDGEGRVKGEGKILHEPGALAAFLAPCAPGSPVAVENWYGIMDEIEKAGGILQARPCGQGQAHAGRGEQDR